MEKILSAEEKTYGSKVNQISNIKLGLLLSEQDFLKKKLELVDDAISCVQFLERYFKLTENRDVVIKVETKEIDLTQASTDFINQLNETK